MERKENFTGPHNHTHKKLFGSYFFVFFFQKMQTAPRYTNKKRGYKETNEKEKKN